MLFKFNKKSLYCNYDEVFFLVIKIKIIITKKPDKKSQDISQIKYYTWQKKKNIINYFYKQFKKSDIITGKGNNIN